MEARTRVINRTKAQALVYKKKFDRLAKEAQQHNFNAVLGEKYDLFEEVRPLLIEKVYDDDKKSAKWLLKVNCPIEESGTEDKAELEGIF